MTFVVAAAGTGGHVFPGLAVGEALVDRGIPRSDILFVGGNRMEAEICPAEGFPFLEVDIRGLRRSLSPSNLSLPLVVRRASKTIAEAIESREARAVLGMGGYVTIPAGLAARRTRVPLFVSEQNASAGLASRVASRWAERTFGSFPETEGLPRAEWVGNPVRRAFWDFDRERLRRCALERYGLEPGVPVVGVFGGSLGSAVINGAVDDLLASWDGPPIQVLHISGERFSDAVSDVEDGRCRRRALAFESAMEDFYAASDLVVARAGGAVAELTATATPSILIPGRFGSGGHQQENARFLERSGAAVVVEEEYLSTLPEALAKVLTEGKLAEMAEAARSIARPHAAHAIADAMLEVAS